MKPKTIRFALIMVIAICSLSIFQNCGNISLQSKSVNSQGACADESIYDIGTSYNSANQTFEFFLRANKQGAVTEFPSGEISWIVNSVVQNTPRATFQLPAVASCQMVNVDATFKDSCGNVVVRSTQFLDPRCQVQAPPPPVVPPPPIIPPPVVPPPPEPPPPVPPPPVVTPPSPVDTTPIRSVDEMLSWGCIRYFGDLEFWNPTTPIPYFIHPTTGAGYPVRIAGAGTVPNTCDRQSFDPIATGSPGQRTINARHLIFEGVVAFRVRIPAGKSNATFNYTEMNLGTMTAGNLYSVSKFPGEIKPSKPNSDEYCNLNYATSFRVSNDNDVGPTVCRIRENEIYFFNVFSPRGEDGDGWVGVGERFVLDLRFNF